MINSTIGWITGNKGLISKTTNSGLTWFRQNSETNNDLYSICFIDENIGWICGNGVILKTVNAGTVWKKDLEISSVILRSIFFIDQYTGWSVGNGGLILKTTTGGSTWILHSKNIIPDEYSLWQNYPNPFNPVTKIKFDIQKSEYTTLKIFDIAGKEIAVLVNEFLSPGSYETIWNADNFPSGIYFAKIQAGNYSQIIKMTLLK